MNDKDTLIKKLFKAKQTCEAMLLLLENGDSNSALIVCDYAFKQLNSLISDLNQATDYSRAFVDVLLKTRMPDFFTDKETIEKAASATLGLKLDAKETTFPDIAHRVPLYVNTVGKAINTVFPTMKWKAVDLFEFLKQEKKKTAVLLGGVLLLCGIIFVRRQWTLSHYSLTGEYFTNQDFSDLYKKTFDPKIDFRWGYEPPFLGFKRDHFSVRWSGFLRIPKDGNYEFTTESDDGVRLWVDDKLILENWTFHSLATDKGSASLKAGFVPIRVEYFEEDSNSELRLLWKYESQSVPHIIEPEFFAPNSKALPPS